MRLNSERKTLLARTMEASPGLTIHELVVLTNTPLSSLNWILGSGIKSGKYQKRYSQETLEPIYFLGGDFTADYHPSTHEEAKLRKARYQAKLNKFLINKFLGK